jgi:cardiolipin synthase (CMP-forming)
VFRHIPNILTVLRLIGTAPVVWLILQREFHWALGVSFLIAVTDSIDGWMARKWKLESRFGALMDPVADKLLVGSGFVALWYVGAMPLWLVGMALGRDLGILLAALVLNRWKGVREFPPSRLGKANTFILMCTVAAVFLDFYPHVFFGISAVIIVVSGARYAWLGIQAAK